MQFLLHKYQDAINFAVNDKTFGVFFSDEPYSDPNIHIHDCCEVVLPLTDGTSFLIDNKCYTVKAGDLFILNQFEAHKLSVDNNTPFARFVLFIHPEYLNCNSTANTDLSHCFYTRGNEILHKISLTDDELTMLQKILIVFRKDCGFGDDIIKRSAVNNFLTVVNQIFLKRATKETGSYGDRTIENTISYIHSNFSAPLTLEAIAKNSFVSVNQLCKAFKNTFDTTVAKYIVAKRISEAKKLLSSGKNVAEVASLCGFCDYANFIRVFKKLVGTSPGKYSKS